jgi:hypothetical protein
MKLFLMLIILLHAGLLLATDNKHEWNASVLTDAVIKKIQQSQSQYKKCVIKEMQEPDYSEQETRQATVNIIKYCESQLAKMRQVYLDANIPQGTADRHLKKMRIQITRQLLNELMFRAAAKTTGQ